jgi:hypothetical protein
MPWKWEYHYRHLAAATSDHYDDGSGDDGGGNDLISSPQY